MNPVTSQGAAAHTAARTGPGAPCSRSHAPAHTPPASRPTRGMHTSIFCRALSLHIFLGQGMARNMPQAMKNPQIQSRIR